MLASDTKSPPFTRHPKYSLLSGVTVTRLRLSCTVFVQYEVSTAKMITVNKYFRFINTLSVFEMPVEDSVGYPVSVSKMILYLKIESAVHHFFERIVFGDQHNSRQII